MGPDKTAPNSDSPKAVPEFTVETIYRIYNSAGSYLEIAPHEDLEEIFRIRQVNATGGNLGSLTADGAHLRKLAEIILKVTE